MKFYLIIQPCFLTEVCNDFHSKRLSNLRAIVSLCELVFPLPGPRFVKVNKFANGSELRASSSDESAIFVAFT